MSTKILLAEDNAPNRYLATFLLEREGFTVSHAANGEEAVEMAASERPDLILMDIQMPKMDGYEAAARIRANPALRGIPLVALTSFAMPGDRTRSIGAGFAGHIEKPIDVETFAGTIRRHLPSQKQESSHS